MPVLELNLDLNMDDSDELDLMTVTKTDLLSCTKTSSSLASSISLSSDTPESKVHSSGEIISPSVHFTIVNLDRSDSISIEKQDKKGRLSVDNSLEKEYDAALSRSDIQQQVRASIASLPGDLQIAHIRLSRRRSWLADKISSIGKLKTPDGNTKRSLRLFDIYQFADKWDILLMIIGSIAALGVGACYPIMFYLYRQLLDTLMVSHNQANSTVNITNPCYQVVNETAMGGSTFDAIKQTINHYVILGFLSMFAGWIGWTSWIVAAERQIRRIRFKLFRNMLRQEIGWFDLHNAGELNSRLVNDLDKMKDGMGDKVADFIGLFGRMVGSLIYALVLGWKLTLVYLSISPLIILAFNITIKVIVKYTLEEVQAFSTASSIVQEVLQNIRTVTAFHGQEKEEKRFTDSLMESKTIGIKKGIYVGLCQSFSTLMNYVGFAIIAWYGPYLSRTECSNYTGGTIIVIFFGSTAATFCLSQVIPNIQNFAEAAASGLHVFDIIKRQTNIDAFSDEGIKPETIAGHIEFRNVTFAYPSRDETSVLNNLSLVIPSGKTVALVGPSGCGKSTIVQMIQRFYDPEHGQIFLDGNNLTKLNVSWLRTHIGIVSQEPVLFTGTIEENIRFGKPDATDEEVQDAAKMANAHEFIMTLPENYKTKSGDRLSGGQKQRVAIARALISNPKILLLDEATSALDNASERVVQDALEKAKQGRTTIIIAHRLSTIRNADLIIGLDHGEVIEHGSHDELMNRRGLYYELVTSQTHKDKDKEDQSDSEPDEEEDDEKKEVKNGSLEPPRISTVRRLSRMSIFSVGSGGLDEGGNELDLSHLANKGKRFRIPFIFRISKFNAPEWYWILLGTVVSIVYGSANPLYGLIFANLYTTFNDPNVHDQEVQSRKYAAIGFCIGLGAGLAQLVTSFCFAKSGEALTMRMRKLTFHAMLRQEISYFDQESNSTGALVTRLSTDTSALKGLTGVRIGIILQSISAAVLGLILGFIATWKVTLIILCFSPVMILSSKMNLKRTSAVKDEKEKHSYVEQAGQHATQAIEHIRTVVALHQESHFIELYENVCNKEFKRQTRIAHLTALSTALGNAILYFLQCAGFGYGSKLIDSGEITYSQLFKVYSIVTMTVFSVGRCIAIMPDYSKAKTAALRIMKLNDRESKIDPHDETGIILDDVVGNVEFLDVSFRYPNRPTLRILKHFTLNCASGQTTALVGPSGSGKSTAITLLQRFYDPRDGKILIDGHDIKVLNTRWLRSLMGVVQQEPMLFNLSIRDNIAYGENSREVTQEEIEAAAKKANIHDVITSLPQGYDTRCGSKGSQLSGGQKQRIAIARALIRNPKILLLDEATSALDNKSEKVVQEALDEARVGRTCLTIAHRLTTIENSDKISVVNRGRMTEEGTHESLIRQNGVYAKLALVQDRSFKI